MKGSLQPVGRDVHLKDDNNFLSLTKVKKMQKGNDPLGAICKGLL